MSGLSGSETFSTEDAVTVAAAMTPAGGRIVPWDRASRSMHYTPGSALDAVDEYDACANVDEGGGVPTLISFFQAHRLILEAAAQNSLTAVYAVWLY